MPHVYNGCGTWYYGKGNRLQYTGTCRSCNRLGTLSAYDTRLWFVLVMVPIIPLARKRIIDDCPSCRRHAAMPLDDWRRAQRRAEEAIAAYRAKPRDAELAKEALRACVSHRHLDAFQSLAPEIERNLPDDAKLLCFLSSAHQMFSHTADEERLLRRALDLDDDDEISEALAQNLLTQGKPDEAAEYLQHIIDDGIPDRVGHLYALAQGYQIKGQHEQALDMFEKCEQINPMIA